MDFEDAWAVAAKDFKIFMKKKSVIYATIFMPLVVGIAFPMIMNYSLHNKNHALAAAAAPSLMDAFSIWFVIGAAIIPTAISSYSLVGEKIQRSLEPMLATPMTDGEILLGKTISGLLIPVVSIYAGSIIFMALMNNFTKDLLGYQYYPNWQIGAILLVAPFASLLSVEINVIISARMNDVRTAQQLGTLLILPFAGLFIASELGFFPLNYTNLMILGGALVILDIALYFVSRATFQREEILTKWK